MQLCIRLLQSGVGHDTGQRLRDFVAEREYLVLGEMLVDQLRRLLVGALPAGRDPGVPHAAVEQPRPPDVLDVLPGMALAEEVAADVDLPDRVQGDGLLVHHDACGEARVPRAVSYTHLTLPTI